MSQPIILIGAARSGTKILRDTIATHEDVGKIGFDVNFIWKRHNESIAHDALGPDHATDRVIRYVRGYFDKQAGGRKMIIEKTVGNSLRVPFVNKVFPDARFIYLYRDGRDVVESVDRQWGTAPGTGYLVKKLLSVPFLDVVPYLFEYAVDLARIRLGLKTTAAYVWGVKYPGFERDLESRSTLEFCAVQWNQCIDAMRRDWDLVKDRGLVVRYEELVSNPSEVLTEIGRFLKLNDSLDGSMIRKGTVGTAKEKLTVDDYDRVAALIRENLEQLGYATAT
ncbi:MAG: sulfotransferase [bacterium]|nr:sulfotransferase [bacterium]